MSTLSTVIVSLCILAVFALPLSRCTGVQSHSWDVNARAAIAGTAHAVDAVDVIAATRFRADIAAAGANTDPVFVQYEPLRQARTLARDSLIVAEHSLDTYAAATTTAEKCRVVATVHQASMDVASLLRLLTDAHVPVASADMAAPGQLDAIVADMAPQCADGGT
jgi:hypothetical protein